MSDVLYKKYPLRENNSSLEYILKEGDLYKLIVDSNKQITTRIVQHEEIPARDNSWLNWSVEELTDYCCQFGIDINDGFKVSLNTFSDDIQDIKLDYSFGVIK